MGTLAVPPLDLLSGTAPAKSGDPARARQAAGEFEALLIGQILHAARQGNAWLSDGDNTEADCATDFAEQHFAQAIARAGGLGLAGMIERGLTGSGKAAADPSAATAPAASATS